MKKLLVALAFIASFWSAPAAAQCNGKFGASTACGSIAGGPPGPIPWSTILGNAIDGLTGDGTATGPGSVVFTLASVNSNVGTFGSATSCVVVTANAKGLITAISTTTCTPAFSSLTGQATLAQLPQLNANSIYANFTGSAAQPTQTAMTACANDGDHALVYVNGTGLQCAVIDSGGTVTSVQLSAGFGIGIVVTAGANPCTTTCNLTISQTTSILTNSLGSSATLNSSTYTTGPTVAQGTTGTWWASGKVTLNDTGVSVVKCKLWDGTTIIDSGETTIPATGLVTTLTLSGSLATPAGNINISCLGSNSTAAMIFNGSGSSKDSTVTVHRIQ